jgi:hypothetical protein
MRRRDLVIIVVAAVVIALVAWAVLASGKSTAPETNPGGAVITMERLVLGLTLPPALA